MESSECQNHRRQQHSAEVNTSTSSQSHSQSTTSRLTTSVIVWGFGLRTDRVKDRFVFYFVRRCVVGVVRMSLPFAVAETWKERLTTCFPDGNSPDEALLRDWQQQTLAQVDTIYSKYHQHTTTAAAFTQEEISQCLNETIRTWKAALPIQGAKSASASASVATSVSLFSGFGTGGLAAFFSWPATAEKTDEEIWQALSEVEYLDDVYHDWETEIQPWIRARLSSSSSTVTTSAACHLFRQWYGKARRQESPETTHITLGMMEMIFQIVADDSAMIETRELLLRRSSSSTLDTSDRSGTTSDPLYRRRLYALAILANMLVMVRVAGFPWATWQAAHGEDVYTLLWSLVHDPATPQRELFVEGLEALLDGSDKQVLAVFRKDWGTIKEQHQEGASHVLQPLGRFASALNGE
eukprot:scaffold4740_cov165-Amphora_coffeaeformis.AAC.24